MGFCYRDCKPVPRHGEAVTEKNNAVSEGPGCPYNNIAAGPERLWVCSF